MTVKFIGNSHLVCVLDAISDWRSQVAYTNKARSEFESEAFAGYSQLTLDSATIPVEVTKNLPKFQPMSICLDTGAMGRAQFIDRYTNSKGVKMSRPGILLKEFTRSLDETDVVVSIIFGSDHSGESLIAKPRHLPRYDFISEFYSRKVSGAVQPLDRQHIERIISDWTLSVRRVTEWIKNTGPRRVVHCLPPPPIRQPECASSREIFSKVIEKYGFLDPTLRIKWYLEYTSALASYLKKKNMVCVSPPQEALEKDGFLLPEYAEGLTHGNQAYGQLLANKIYAALV